MTPKDLQLDFDFDAAPNYRADDPTTSKDAGLSKRLRMRIGSQRHRLFCAFQELGELTAEGAGLATGLALKDNCCYWKRVSEMLAEGYLIDTGREAESRAGEMQRVLMINPDAHNVEFFGKPVADAGNGNIEHDEK